MTADKLTQPKPGGGRFKVMSPAGLALIVIASVIAVAVVPFWVLSGAEPKGPSRWFVSTPEFAIWLLILCGQAAIWVGSLGYVAITVRRRWRDLRRRQALSGAAFAALIASAGTLLLLVFLLIVAPRLGLFDEVGSAGRPIGSRWPLDDHDLRVLPLVGVGVAIGLFAIVGMWLTTVALIDVGRRAAPRAAAVRRFITLRSELTALLAVAGTLVGLATLSSGALREAVLALGDRPLYRNRAAACLERRLAGSAPTAAEIRRTVRAEFHELLDDYPACTRPAFDREYVLAYGLLFTAILGIAFAPTFVALRHAGARLRNRSYPLPRPRDSTFFDVVEHREKFDALLQTNLSATATFKAGVAILTPLAASVISTYVPS